MEKKKAFSAKRNTGTLFTIPVVISLVILCIIILRRIRSVDCTV